MRLRRFFVPRHKNQHRQSRCWFLVTRRGHLGPKSRRKRRLGLEIWHLRMPISPPAGLCLGARRLHCQERALSRNPSIMRRLGLLSLACKFLEALMPCTTLTPTRMYETVDISIGFNTGHRARLCQPPPEPKWDPSHLSLQRWDSIPCQGGWRSWKRHWFTYLSLTSR